MIKKTSIKNAFRIFFFLQNDFFLIDSFAFNFKNEMRVWRDIWRSSLSSITHLRWNGQTSFATNFHAINTDIPTFDDFTFAKTELEGFAIQGGVKGLLVRLGLAFVIHANHFAFLGLESIAKAKIFSNDSTFQGSLGSFLSLRTFLTFFGWSLLTFFSWSLLTFLGWSVLHGFIGTFFIFVFLLFLGRLSLRSWSLLGGIFLGTDRFFLILLGSTIQLFFLL